MRRTFSRVAQELANDDLDVMILLGDIGVFAFRDSLIQIPNRVFNMGILEQSMIGIAAGMAKSGHFPIVHTIAPFLVERAHEQLKVDFGYQELPGNFVSVGASIDYASLGGTHHAPADVESLLGIPGFQICIPGHADEFEEQLRTHYRNSSPTYYRLSEDSNSTPYMNPSQTVFSIEKGKKATVIAVGPYLQRTLDAVSTEGFEILYLNEISMTTVHELGGLITNNIVFLVEPFYEGTLNRLLSEALRNRMISIRNIGIPRNFIHMYGSSSEIEECLELSALQIRNRIIEHLHV
jgi:transketolase